MLSPKLTLLLFENVTAWSAFVVVPADTVIDAAEGGATDAVRVDPLKPKETPFEFEKMTFEKLFDVVPALMLIAVSAPAAT